MRLFRKDQIAGTSRHVRNDVYETSRLLLAEDGAGCTVTDIVITPGREEIYGYDAHQEVAYCISGRARLTELPHGPSHEITPGTLWVARPGERFRFIADEPTRLICVFTPPLTGSETGMAADMKDES